MPPRCTTHLFPGFEFAFDDASGLFTCANCGEFVHQSPSSIANGCHKAACAVHTRACSMLQPGDTLAGAQVRMGSKRARSELEDLVTSSHVHGKSIRLRTTWSGARGGSAWICRGAFGHLVSRAQESLSRVKVGVGNTWKPMAGDRWQGFVVLQEGLALHELVSWAVQPFSEKGYSLRRNQYMILWGKGETQPPHVDGHFVTPNRRDTVQVDDALSVLMYLDDREVSLCTRGEDICLSMHAGDVLVMSSHTWHRGLASDTSSGVVFASLDRSAEANKESDRFFFRELADTAEIPAEYELNLHASSSWGGIANRVESVLRGRSH
jgi:hypothetical protein